MKRLMMLVAMMAVVLLLPMNVVAAEGDVVNEDSYYNLTEDVVIQGVLYVVRDLDMGGYKLTVEGNVYMEEDILLDDGELVIGGDLIMEAGCLDAGDGKVKIGGDWTIAPTAMYTYTSTMYCMYSTGDRGTITVNGDLTIKEDYDNVYNQGTVIVNGNVTRSEEYEGEVTFGTLILAGTSTQVVDVNAGMVFSKILFYGSDMQINNYLNGTLGDHPTNVKFKDNNLKTSGLNLNTFDVTIPGNVIAEGDVKADGGSFVVKGDYVQQAGALECGAGLNYIGGSLKIQAIDADGKYVTGEGLLKVYKDATLYVGGDLIIDTTMLFLAPDLYGTIKLDGDLTEKSASDFNPTYVILSGSEHQSITLNEDSDSYIGTLELTQGKENYTFNPDPCWNNLIQLEGIVNSGDVFKYYEDGKWIADAHKYVEYDGATFLVANGVVATNINGIAQDPLNLQDWYFLSGGQVQEQHTGLAEYDGQWFYIEEGKLDTTMSKCVEYDGESFMFAAGRLLGETSGLVQDPNDGVWYYLAGGRVLAEFSGLAYYDGEWFYVSNVKLDNTYKGCAMVDGVVFRVENGVIIGEGHTSSNGKCTHCGKITSAHASLWSPY